MKHALVPRLDVLEVGDGGVGKQLGGVLGEVFDKLAGVAGRFLKAHLRFLGAADVDIRAPSDG